MKMQSEQIEKASESYLQIFLRFLHFGSLAWGGPVAQIAMIRKDLVESEGWISSQRFNRLLAVYQVLPGPETHELCVYLGMLRKGRLGGFLAGLGFMLPGFLLMLVLSWLYVSFQITQTQFVVLFYGIQPAVIALIVRGVHRIGRHVVVNGWLWIIAIGSATAALFGTSFWVTLPIAGLIYVFLGWRRYIPAAVLSTVLLIIVLAFALDLVSRGKEAQNPQLSGRGSSEQTSLHKLFFSGLRSGLLTFGGAYTVIPFLQYDAVVRGGWMTNREFLDGLALSGILPAPLIIFSTFVGYAGNGPWGAVVMTIGIFTPAFLFSLFLYNQLERLVENPTLHSFLDGVTGAVVGLIAATAVDLGRTAGRNSPDLLTSVAIFIGALSVLYLWQSKLSVPVTVLVAGAVGFLFF